MPRLRSAIKVIIGDLFNFNILLIPFAFLAAAMYRNIYMPLSLLLFIAILPYNYFLRLKIKKLSKFLFLTWLSCGIGLLSNHKVFYTLFIAFICSSSVKSRTSEESELRLGFETLCFPLVFLTVFYGLSDFLGIEQMRTFFYFQALAVVVLAILYTHLRGINSELELASADSLQSTKLITGFANKMIFMYIVGFVIVLLLFRYVPFGKAAIYIVQFIVYIIRYILSFFSGSDTPALGSPLTPQSQPPVDLTISDQPVWLAFLERILIYAVNIIVLLVILLFIAMFLLKLYRGFYARKYANISYSGATSTVTALQKPSIKTRFSKKISNSIRRKYFKRINKYFKKNLLSKAYTPNQIEDKLNDRENLGELTKLYEQTRYSKTED